MPCGTRKNLPMLYHSVIYTFWSFGINEVIWNNVEIEYYYGKCPKISYTKVSDKMAYADYTGSTLFAIPLSILGNNCTKSKIWAKKRYGIKCSKF